MSAESYMGSELGMEQAQVHVSMVARLGFARGKVGQQYPLTSPEEETAHAEQLADHTYELTKSNTADCGDERRTLWLADGTDDPDILRARIVPQLFGGLGLATTKALVAADAAMVKGANNMWEAYERVSRSLAENFGEEDGGHGGCGASLSVESSVANPIPMEMLIPSLGVFMPMDARTEGLVRVNAAEKERRLQAGFYGGWEAVKHEEYLRSRFPQNFSHLAVDPEDQETHGHHGSSVYVITSEGHGLAKNALIENSGQEAFGLTLPKMRQLAHMLGGSDEERARILLGFYDDSLHVGGGIVTKGMPVFAEAA